MDLQFKNSIKIGMPYDLFWYGCPSFYYVYEEVYLDSIKEKMMLSDLSNWQLGKYIQIAIGSAMDKKTKYPNKPLFDPYEGERKKTRQESLSMVDKFKIMASNINKSLKNKQ